MSWTYDSYGTILALFRRILGQYPAAPCSPGPCVLLLNWVLCRVPNQFLTQSLSQSGFCQFEGGRSKKLRSTRSLNIATLPLQHPRAAQHLLSQSSTPLLGCNPPPLGTLFSADICNTSRDICVIPYETGLEEPQGHPPKGHRENMIIQITYQIQVKFKRNSGKI